MNVVLCSGVVGVVVAVVFFVVVVVVVADYYGTVSLGSASGPRRFAVRARRRGRHGVGRLSTKTADVSLTNWSRDFEY